MTRLPCALMLFAGLVSPGYAQTAAEFEGLKAPPECVTLWVSLDRIVQARDRGTTKAQIMEFAKSVDPKYAIPQQAIDDIFDEPRPRGQEALWYWTQACKARAYQVPFAPFSQVLPVLRECPFDGKESPCLLRATNVALDRPRDFQPPTPPPSS